MKFILSLCLISFSFLASAETTTVSNFDNSVSIEAGYPGGPGKKGRRNKRINKKRKKKCKQFGRRSFAG